MHVLDPTEAAELRRRVIDAGVDTFRADGYGSTHFPAVASTADLDLETVESLFPSWDLLAIAILDRWAGANRRDRVGVAESQGAVAFVRSLLEASAADPALIRVRLALLGAAADLNHPGRGWYRAQYAQFVQDVALFFTRDIVAKREPRTVAPKHAAEQLIALYEGLMMQSTLLDTVDLLASWDRAINRLRDGWAVSAR